MDARRIGDWTLVTHTKFGPGHELARPGLDAFPSIVVSEGPSHAGLDRWPFYDGPRLARRRAVIQQGDGWVVLEDVGLATSLAPFPSVFPIGMAWALGAAIARSLAEVHAGAFVIGGLAPSLVFVDSDRDVIFAPRVLAFRPLSERTTTPEADVSALVGMLRSRIEPRDRETFDAATGGASTATALFERFGSRDSKSRDALAAWMGVTRTSLERRIDWVLGVAAAPRETVIAAFDEIAARLGSSHRLILESPQHDNTDFMLDTEIVWEMQRGGGSPPYDPFPDVLSTHLRELGKVDADGLERACKTILLNRLVGIREEFCCPTCGSTSVACEYMYEITTLTCAGCGRKDTVDLVELAEWRE